MIVRILSVALAAWLGGGAIAYGTGHARYGLTPSIAWLVAAIVAAIVVRRSRWPLLALVCLLPWLPFRVPPAFLIWTGPATAWVTGLIAVAMMAGAVHRRAPAALRNTFTDPTRAPIVAVAASSVLFLLSAWSVSPQLPQGDEPHYLIISQSLLADRDLRIENNYTRGDYHAYFPSDLRPDYLRRGTDGQIYSIHAPGLPAIVAPVFALAGYHGVVVFLALVSAAATGLVWVVAFRITGNATATWFGWSVVTLSEPFLVQSFMVYPDALAGAIVILAIATMLLGADATLRRLALTGLALAVLPWLHTRAVLLAVPLALVIAARQIRSPKRLAVLAAAPLVSAAAWFAFFYSVYGTPDPRAPYAGAQQMTVASLPRGLVGLLFDQQFGLLANAPVFLFAALGFVPLLARRKRIAIELMAGLAPYAIAVACFPMWWAGYTTPARFLVPILLPLAIPAATWFDAVRRDASRAVGLIALAVSAAITVSVVGVDRGAMLLNFRDGASRLLVWLSPVVDLTTAVPSLFRSPLRLVIWQTSVWLLLAAAAMVIARLRFVQTLTPNGQRLIVAAVAVTLTMAAASVEWRSHASPSLKPDGGALAYLSTYDGDARQFAVSLSPLHRIRRVDVPARLALFDGAPLKDEPLLYVRRAPAATYAIELALSRAAEGRLAVSLDRTFGPMWTFDAAGATGIWRRDVVVPVASSVLFIDAEPRLRASIDHVSVRALVVPGSGHRIVDRRAEGVARYGRVLMFLLGGEAFMEPTGTWVQGGASADLAIVADDRRPVQLLVRTPPVANQVTLDGDGWHRDIPLAAGESTIVEVPTGRLRVRVRSGARPAEFEPGSPDVRFLGAWIEPR